MSYGIIDIANIHLSNLFGINVDLLIIEPLDKYYSEILIKIQTFVIEDSVNCFVVATLQNTVNYSEQKLPHST